jgi:hypothetical protein
MIKLKTEFVVDIPDDNSIHKFDALPIFEEIFNHDCYKIDDIINNLNSDENVIWDIGSHLGFLI